MIQDTADCTNCAFKTKKGEKCPNYIETLWDEKDAVQPKIIKDCAPKRTLLMLQELYNRTFALQTQINQAENQIIELKGQFKMLMNAIHYISEKEKPVEIGE